MSDGGDPCQGFAKSPVSGLIFHRVLTQNHYDALDFDNTSTLQSQRCYPRRISTQRSDQLRRLLTGFASVVSQMD